MADNKKQDPKELKSDLSRFMSLAIKANTKNVTLHQAIWKLQKFKFMQFSDKFQRVNLYDYLLDDGDDGEEEKAIEEENEGEEGEIEEEEKEENK